MTHALHTDDELVPIRMGLDQFNAGVLKSALEACGIPVFLHTENIQIYGHSPYTDILVRRSDQVEAEKALQNVATLPSGTFRFHRDEDGDYSECTSCGSLRVRPYTGRVPTFVPGLYLHAEKDSGWFFCAQCGTHFRNRQSRFSVLPFALLLGGIAGACVMAVYWLISWLKWL